MSLRVADVMVPAGLSSVHVLEGICLGAYPVSVEWTHFSSTRRNSFELEKEGSTELLQIYRSALVSVSILVTRRRWVLSAVSRRKARMTYSRL